MLRIFTTALLAASIASANAETWTSESGVTYRTEGNMTYGSNGVVARRDGDTLTLLVPPHHHGKYRGFTICRKTTAERMDCN
jgi:hypothetical protein